MSTRWIQLRKQLFQQIRQQVTHRLGEESPGLARYRKNYESDLKKKWKESSKTEVLTAVSQAPLVFMGDFHALQQSQKAQLRILKAIKNPGRWIVALECVEARHQKTLDQFLAGKISERDFLKACEWKKSWGFPWEHYRPLFRWLQKNKVKTFGVNLKTNRRSAQTLKDRDHFSAGEIAKIHQKFPEAPVFVIFGDLHLGSLHLPKELAKKSDRSWVSEAVYLYQNNEPAYFQMIEKGLDLDVDVIRFNSKMFCLQNVPPWVKWQNYLLFLEESYDSELAGEFEHEIDYTDHVAQYLKLIGEDLQHPIRTDHFSIYSLRDDQFWVQLQKKLSEQEIKFCEILLSSGRSFYWPEVSAGLLARPSVNHAAELAMSIYSATLAGYKKWPQKFPDQFPHLIWLEAVRYFGTKLVNPKRKTDTMTDLKKALMTNHPEPQSQEVLQLALSQKMLELVTLSGSGRQRQLQRPRRVLSYLEAAKILGGMLGEKLYYAHRSRLISSTSLLALFRKNPESEKFTDLYWEILELAENLPEPFQSKTDRL